MKQNVLRLFFVFVFTVNENHIVNLEPLPELSTKNRVFYIFLVGLKLRHLLPYRSQ